MILNFKLEERIKQNEEIVLLQKNDYKVANGTVKILEGINVKMLFKVQYIIYKPIQTTILEYKVNDINNKSYIIEEEKQKYSLREINKFLSLLTIYNNLINVANLKENISIKDIEITEPKEENTSLKKIISYINLFTI